MSRHGISTLERAFQLARAGTCHSLADIRRQLVVERHDNIQGHLHGPTIQRQLKAALAERGIKPSLFEDEGGA